MYEEYVSFLVLLRFFLSPDGAAVFFPASFFSAGAFPPAGALPPVEGFFSAALGGISGWTVRLIWKKESDFQSEDIKLLEADAQDNSDV